MILSRFYFGYYGVKVGEYFILDHTERPLTLLKVALFNCLACLGWSAVNVIVGAQLIHAVNPEVPGFAGIIIIAACTFLITLFGYKVVHIYEMYSWIPCFIIFLIVLGEFAHSGKFVNIDMGSGSAEAGSVLSFAASVFGFATGWTSYAADYTVYQPVGTSRLKVFCWVYAGLIFPLLFTEMLGLAVTTATVNDPTFEAMYQSDHIGGLLGAVLFGPLGRFGKFCVVVLALSIIGNNCPNIYSLSFSLQILGRWTQRVPRFLWTFIGTLVYVAIAIPGYNNFEAALENFMLLIVSSACQIISTPLLIASSFRATGSPSTKASPSQNTSSSSVASVATHPKSMINPPNSHLALQPLEHSASVSSVLSWAWLRSGLLDRSERRLVTRCLVVMLASNLRSHSPALLIAFSDLSRRSILAGKVDNEGWGLIPFSAIFGGLMVISNSYR
jgi:hypothetical protein